MASGNTFRLRPGVALAVALLAVSATWLAGSASATTRAKAPLATLVFAFHPF